MEEVKTAILFCNDTLVNFIVKKTSFVFCYFPFFITFVSYYS